MQDDILVKRAYFKDCTLSRVFAEGFSAFGLELPWLGNAINVSCIPEGVYKYEIAPSARLNGKPAIWIQRVEERTAIQVHPGNYTDDILGCLVVGDRIMYLNSDSIPDVGNSVDTFEELLDSIPAKGTIRFTDSAQPGTGVYR